MANKIVEHCFVLLFIVYIKSFVVTFRYVWSKNILQKHNVVILYSPNILIDSNLQMVFFTTYTNTPSKNLLSSTAISTLMQLLTLVLQ